MDETDKQRMKGRLWGEEVLSALDGESMSFIEGFWRCLKKELKPKEIDPKAMTDEEAQRYGKRIVEFGKHRGKRYDDVPLDYWEWLADENREIQRYLRSRRIRAEQHGR